MGSKEIAIFGILLAIVLLISSEVAARELVETSNTINTSKEDEKINGDNGDAITYPGRNPKRPFCNGKVYAGCIPAVPKRRKCDYKNICKPPGTSPTKDASMETIVGGQKTDAEVQAKPHN